MRALSLIPALVMLTACEGGLPAVDNGPLALGIVSGQNQVATAGSERLAQPVVGKLVRQPGGGIAFRLVTPAYAEGTVVQGSPVPGAVVCAVSVTEGGMVPFTPCTNTGSDGTATFFFAPGTKAGEARSEIRGVVDGQPAVFDTARAVVQPGPLARWYVGPVGGRVYTVSDGDTVRIDTIPRIVGEDQYANEIGRDSVLSHSARWIWQPFVYNGGAPDAPPADARTGWTVVVPDSASAWNTRSYGANAVLVMWLDGARETVYFDVRP